MVRKKSKKTEMRELDNMWKEKVRTRDNWTCQVCKKKLEPKNCHSHHILPKRMKGARWDVDNGIALCFNHHKVGNFSPHMNAIWFTFWLKTNKPKQFNYIIDKLKNLNGK